MQNPTDYIKAQIESTIKAALNNIQSGYESFDIEIPANRSFGDFSCNAAMKNAKVYKTAPRILAENILKNADFSNTYIEKAEIAGPGFINFFVNEKYLNDIVYSVYENEEYGKTDINKGKRLLVEFVSANPTGPMHIGNARGGALGDCLSEIFSYTGYEVEREFYINDAGNQIEKFAKSLELRYLQIFDESIQMPEDCYLGQDIIDHAKAFYELNGDKYLNSDAQSRKNALVEFALPKNIQGLKEDLKKYRIEYDTWFKESTLHKNGEVDRIINLLKEAGYTYESEGAVWFKGSEFDCEDFVLVRSNGVCTYVVPDIAYHYNKLAVRNFDMAIDVLGADHHGYAPRLKAALKALSIDPSRLCFVLMQMVRLVRDGEVVKASKRSGKAITLSTLLDEIPIDAARFFFNLRQPDSHFDFDLDLAMEQTNQNPVYYVQYAHARISSILRLADVPFENALADLLKTPEEKEIIMYLGNFPSQIINAAEMKDPSVITRYLMDLAALFHKFYNAHKVMCEDEELKKARLMLCYCVKKVIKTGLKILAVEAPDKM